MKKDYKKQFVSLLRLLEEQRKESSSNTFAFDFPDDLQGIEIKNHDDLSEFSKYISTWYSDYSISAYLEYNDIPSLHDSDGIEINLIVVLDDKQEYLHLLDYMGIKEFGQSPSPKIVYQLENGLIIDVAGAMLKYKSNLLAMSMDSQSAKLLLALVKNANVSGEPLSKDILSEYVLGKISTTPGSDVTRYKKVLSQRLKKLGLPKEEIDVITRYVKGVGYKCGYSVDILR